ncbi:hypothetical protein ACFWUP_18345 [Nocardia sp. NPDC058658]|uniref:hypothetical protein n=1 Tax=Nocardia sp. NPDC058658 TaxID=3346580 RepID=UPI003652B89C
MDYAAEIEQIAAEARRRSALLMEEIDEINRQTAIRAEEFAIEAGNRLRELAEQDSEAESEPEPEPTAQPSTREDWSQPPVRQQAPPPPTLVEPDPNWTPEQLRQAEIRAAVARARAARQAQSTVAPSDGDFDPESEYYRRSTWLD